MICRPFYIQSNMGILAQHTRPGTSLLFVIVLLNLVFNRHPLASFSKAEIISHIESFGTPNHQKRYTITSMNEDAMSLMLLQRN